jgi:hypothetical protein
MASEVHHSRFGDRTMSEFVLRLLFIYTDPHPSIKGMNHGGPLTRRFCRRPTAAAERQRYALDWSMLQVVASFFIDPFPPFTVESDSGQEPTP